LSARQPEGVGRCTFEAIIEDYHLQGPELGRLALIVHAADAMGQEHTAAEGIGLRAITRGSTRWAFPMKIGWQGSFQSTTRSMSSRVECHERLDP
jgi:hypothetical protein